MADNRDPGFVQRVLQMFSPVRAAQSIGESFQTFGDIVNNRGVTDEQVQQAGQVLGAIGTPTTLGRFPVGRQNVPMRAALRAETMSPELRSYGRGMQDARGRPGIEPVDTTSTPNLSQNYVEGWQAGRPSPQRSTQPAAPASQPDVAPVQPREMSPTPAQNPQASPGMSQGDVQAPKTQRSSRFSNDQKDAVLKEMDKGKSPKEFADPRERKYARYLDTLASELGVPVSKLWEMRVSNVRKTPWAIGLIAGTAATNAMMNDNGRENAMMKRGQ